MKSWYSLTMPWHLSRWSQSRGSVLSKGTRIQRAPPFLQMTTRDLHPHAYVQDK